MSLIFLSDDASRKNLPHAWGTFEQALGTSEHEVTENKCK